jgi:hypothetical protein
LAFATLEQHLRVADPEPALDATTAPQLPLLNQCQSTLLLRKRLTD